MPSSLVGHVLAGLRQVQVTANVPSEQATRATLLQGGVVLSDETTWWFGEAVAR